MRRYPFALISLLAVLTIAHFAIAADEAAKPAPVKPDFVVSDMRIQKIPGPTILCAESETTLSKISDISQKNIAALEKAATGAHVQMQGPVVFVYQGATGQPDQPFKLTIGLMVEAETKPLGDFKVKKLDDFRCATVIYSGSMANVGNATQKLFRSLFTAGHKPTGEMREYYLYWESPESPNNILQIQAGIQ